MREYSTHRLIQSHINNALQSCCHCKSSRLDSKQSVWNSGAGVSIYYTKVKTHTATRRLEEELENVMAGKYQLMLNQNPSRTGEGCDNPREKKKKDISLLSRSIIESSWHWWILTSAGLYYQPPPATAQAVNVTDDESIKCLLMKLRLIIKEDHCACIC